MLRLRDRLGLAQPLLHDPATDATITAAAPITSGVTCSSTNTA